MRDIESVLILGTGPASVQLAVLFRSGLGCRVGIAGRESVRSAPFFAALRESGGTVRVTVRNEKHGRVAGECAVDRVFRGYENAAGDWDTVVLAVTTDAYLPVLKRLDRRIAGRAKRVVLLSPTFGSGFIVGAYLRELASEAEVISFSTYLGDTRWPDGKPSSRAVTAGVKKKVFAGSTHGRSGAMRTLGMLFERAGIALEDLDSPLEAESRNISLYVHPPLFMNDYALEAVFDGADATRYVYKLYPEGPVTMGVMRDMRAQWEEMTRLAEKLGLPGLNLLKFMTDDNYPVRPESLPRGDVEHFPHLAPIHQEYLLYVRYASLLIDPFSEPDGEGRYADFSAVPIRPIYVNAEGEWEIPRMPKEDYYRIKMIQGIARMADSACPTIDRFVAVYEGKLTETARALRGERLSDAFAVRSFEEDLRLVRSGLGRFVEDE